MRWDSLGIFGYWDASICEVGICVWVVRMDWMVEIEISQRLRELSHRAGPLASRHLPALERSGGGIRSGGIAFRGVQSSRLERPAKAWR